MEFGASRKISRMMEQKRSHPVGLTGPMRSRVNLTFSVDRRGMRPTAAVARLSTSGRAPGGGREEQSRGLVLRMRHRFRSGNAW